MKPMSMIRSGVMAAAVFSAAMTVPTTAMAIDSWDWIFVGQGHGVEIHHARIPNSDTVRPMYTNTNGYAVEVRFEETIVWCGGRAAGQGEPRRMYANRVVIDAYSRASRPGWNTRCDRNLPYYVEFNNMTVERR